MSKKVCFRTALDSQHVTASQILLQSAPQQFYHILLSLWVELSWKISLLVISEILGLFVNTLSPDEECSLGNRDNSSQSGQMPLSKKQETFLEFVAVILKPISNFEHFKEKKHDPHRLCIPEIIDCKIRAYISVYNSQHVKGSQRLLKSARQQFYCIVWSLW